MITSKNQLLIPATGWTKLRLTRATYFNRYIGMIYKRRSESDDSIINTKTSKIVHFRLFFVDLTIEGNIHICLETSTIVGHNIDMWIFILGDISVLCRIILFKRIYFLQNTKLLICYFPKPSILVIMTFLNIKGNDKDWMLNRLSSPISTNINIFLYLYLCIYILESKRFRKAPVSWFHVSDIETDFKILEFRNHRTTPLNDTCWIALGCN